MIYILSTLVLLFLIFFGMKEYQNTEITIRKFFIPGLLFKIIGGVGVGMLYSQYYPSGDTVGFFEDAKRIAQLTTSDGMQFLKFLWNGNSDFEIWNGLHFTQPRALFFSKVTAVGYLVGFGNYWAVATLFSILSFFTAWKLVEKITEYFPATREAAVLAFLFFPSVVFWSSGLMKESLAMAGLFLVVYVFIKLWVQKRISIVEALILLVGFWFLWNLKYYFAGILLVSIGGMWISRMIISQRPTLHAVKIIFLFLLIMVIPALLVTQLHPNFNISRILEVVIKNHDAYREISDPANLIDYYQLKAMPGSVLLNAPWALLSGLFRPFVWEARTFFQFLAGAETLLVLVLFLNTLRRIKKISFEPGLLLLLGVGTYITLLAIFLALSTPNIGTLVRYRVGFYPFFVYLLLIANPWITQRNRLL